eukprot:14634345-Alexandrium_andersonii.AAC.1
MALLPCRRSIAGGDTSSLSCVAPRLCRGYSACTGALQCRRCAHSVTELHRLALACACQASILVF